MTVKLRFGFKLESAGNARHGHWAQRHKLNHRLRLLAYGHLRAHFRNGFPEWTRAFVVFLRVAPRGLDAEDNLPMAFKPLRDGIADALLGNFKGGNDADPRISWAYGQERRGREYVVEIEIDLQGPGL